MNNEEKNELKTQVDNNSMMVQEIPVGNISPNPYQPRLSFDDAKLSSLADSIRRYGVMQPIVVTQKADGKYELISGERRLRASKLAGLETIPSVVRGREHSNEEKFELAIIENVQREDLNPVDKARAFKKLTDEFGFTHSQIAEKLGKSREYISNSLRILALPDNMLDAIARGDITEGHAKPLLMLNDRPLEQQELLSRIIANGLTVRAAIQSARNIIAKKDSGAKKIDPEIKQMEKKLSEKLGTRVHIDQKNESDGGKLTIEFFSKEDLEKIMDLVRGKGLSAVPNLGDDEAVANFNNNFSDNNEAEIFAEEIDSLDNQKTKEAVLTGNQGVQENIQIEEDSDLDGFRITSFNHNNQKANEVEVKSEHKFNDKIDEWKQDDEVIKTQNSDGAEVVKKEIEMALENINQEIEDTSANFLQDINNFSINNNSSDGRQVPEKENLNNFNTDLGSFKESFGQDNNNIEAESKEEDRIEEVVQKTNNLDNDRQKRINAILSGQSTVEDEYNISSTEAEEVRKTPEAESVVSDEAGKKKDDIETSSVYQQFLESKKRIEEEKRRVFSDGGGTGMMADNAREFLGTRGQDLSDDKKENTISESLRDAVEELKNDAVDEVTNMTVDNINNSDNDGVVAEAKVENVFAGDSFVPEIKKEEEKRKEDSEDEAYNPENTDSVKPGFGTFSI